MQHSNSSLSLSSNSYCHNISAENYFLSPKMPIKDHANAFRTTISSFKPNQTQVLSPLSRNRRASWKRWT